MITLESVVIAVLGAVLGVVLGIGFGVALMYAVRDEGLDVIDVPLGQLGAVPGPGGRHRRRRGDPARPAGPPASTC